MSESRTPLRARVVVGSTTECRSYRAGRVCLAGGCTTVLSIYNASSRCALHERRPTQWDVPSTREPWN